MTGTDAATDLVADTQDDGRAEASADSRADSRADSGADSRAETPADDASAADFPVPRPLLVMTTLEAVVLFVSGTGLAFQPELTARWWPWADLTLFNSRFLGGIYLTSLVAVGCLLATRRWSPARVVVPMIGIFTLCVIIVSAVYLSRFEFAERPLPVAGWFVLYIALPTCSFWYLWRSRARPPAVAAVLPNGWRSWLRIFSALLAGYGVALLVAPEQVTAFWPWAVDAFHGQLYAATFLAGGVGAWLISARAARAEVLTVGLTQAAFGVFAIAGVYLVDVETGRVDWSAPGTAAWLTIMSACAASGLVLVARARTWR